MGNITNITIINFKRHGFPILSIIAAEKSKRKVWKKKKKKKEARDRFLSHLFGLICFVKTLGITVFGETI